MTNKSRNASIGMLVIAIFLICWGLVWFGNDLGWWSINFPFWPFIVILVGLAIIIHELIKKTE